MRELITAAIAALLLGGCQTDGSPAPNAYQAAFPEAHYTDFRDLSPTERALVTTGIRAKLKDPDSAQFKLTKITKSVAEGGRFYYCGMVNAKNSYGGYTGFSPFWAWVYSSPKGEIVRA